MAHSRSSKKRIRQNEKRHEANRGILTSLKTQMKKVRAAVEKKDKAVAAAEFTRLQKLVDKAAKTNRIHRNRAARVKSRLGSAVAAVGTG